MRAKYTKVRLWVIGPFLVYLLVFLLWFPNWEHAPQSALARALGFAFGTMTAVLAVVAVVGGFCVPRSVLRTTTVPGGSGIIAGIVETAIQLYKTFIAKESNEPVLDAGEKRRSFLPATPPPLEITKRLKNGTPVRGACPLCELEFSTEAFDSDMTFPHASTLHKWYEEHYAAHLEES